MTGFELLAAVKADERMKYLPVILLSARAGDEAAVEGLQAGAGTLSFRFFSLFPLNFIPHVLCWMVTNLYSSKIDDYLIKPFAAKELLARVSTHLELSRFRRELERVVRERTAKVKKWEGEG